MANTYTLIASTTVGSGGASFITFSPISSNYTDLVLKVSARDNRSSNPSDDFKVTINNNTSATYTTKRLSGISSVSSDGASGTGPANSYSGVLTGPTSTGNTFGNTEFYFPNYTSSDVKSWICTGSGETNSTYAQLSMYVNLTSDTNAITSIKLEGYNDNNIQQYSTAYLYGIKNS